MRVTVIALGTVLGIVQLPAATNAGRPGECPPPGLLQLCLGPTQNTCTDDSSCADYTKKCCPNPCNKECVTAVNVPPGTQVKEGRCPGAPMNPHKSAHVCKHRGTKVCAHDAECAGREKCCPSFCGNKCVAPDPHDPCSGQCPSSQSSGSCSGYIRQRCFFDSDCPSSHKCCLRGCETTCERTVTKRAPKKGKCAKGPERPYNCDHVSAETECTYDGDCRGSDKCCPSFCDMICTRPEIHPRKTGECPEKHDTSSESCDHSRHSECDFHYECDGGKLCCVIGCRKKCVNPSHAAAGRDR